MLPHDEIMHYGIRGMRWGIRRKLDKAARLESDSHAIDNEARKIRNGVPNQYTTGKKYYESNKKGASRRESLASAFELSAKMDREQAKRLRASAEVKAREVRMRADNKNRDRELKRMQKARDKFSEKKSIDKPYQKRYEKKNKEIFEKAVTNIATSVTIGVIGKLLGPTADSYGQSLATKLGRQVKNVASNSTRQATKETVKEAARAAESIFDYTIDPKSNQY